MVRPLDSPRNLGRKNRCSKEKKKLQCHHLSDSPLTVYDIDAVSPRNNIPGEAYQAISPPCSPSDDNCIVEPTTKIDSHSDAPAKVTPSKPAYKLNGRSRRALSDDTVSGTKEDQVGEEDHAC
jgi:hypothetical protein